MSVESIRNGKRSRNNVDLSNEGKFDRISELPDAIILHILSFVRAEDAVRSGILSKRFAYLWTNISCLHFEESSPEFVKTTLLFHKRSNLEKVSVIYYNFVDNDLDQVIDEIEFRRLVRLLSLANVKDMTLRLNKKCCYMLPQHFYSNPSLKKLALGFCKIVTTGFVNWKSLLILCMLSIDLSDSTINDVLSGCPSLECLELTYCLCNFGQINLTNNKCLRKMEINCYDGEGTLEIFAPYLQSLVLSGDMWCCKCRVLNAGSLIDCYLDFYGDGPLSNKDSAISMLTSLLHDLSHVEVVTIGEWVLQVLCLIELNGLPCSMSKSVKCLKLDTCLMTNEMVGIVWLLRGLTLLEKLFINKMKHGRYYIPWSTRLDQVTQEDESYWTSENMKTGIDLKLKTVEICGFKADRKLLYEKNEALLLVEFLLKTAKFMENMTIGAYGSEHYLLKLTERLLGFRRSSPHAIIKISHLK